MSKTAHYLKYLILVTLVAGSCQLWASGGTGEHAFDWPVRGELLAYHSIGCADACWVAEVRTKASRQIKARLRCDADQLYFSQPGKNKERLLPEGCASYNDSSDKASLISNKLMLLLKHQAAKK